MNRSVFLLTAAVVAFSAATATAQTLSGIAPLEGLLLLKNGEILTGSITRSGDYYVVATSDSEIQIRLHDADAVCRDLDEAYRRKAAKVNPRSTEEHVLLAQWCIDRQLYGHAARELTEAYRIDDTHPRIVLLERRLRAEMSKPKSAPAPAAAPTPPALSDEQLEQTVRSISPEALQEFTVRVQPLLVNYCATAGCHGPKAGSRFQLHRVYLNERNDPRLVRMNLHAVMAQLDPKQVTSSPLLTVPLVPHGGGKKPLFTPHNAEHYRLMAAWATRVSAATSGSATTAAAPTTVPPSAGALMQRMSIVPPIADPPTAAVGPPSPAVTPPVAPPPSVGPIDPFDPAAFNRRREANLPPSGEGGRKPDEVTPASP